MNVKEINIGDYVEIFSGEITGGWSIAKCVDMISGEKGFQIHNTRIILEENEIDEFGERVTKPIWGTEY